MNAQQTVALNQAQKEVLSALATLPIPQTEASAKAADAEYVQELLTIYGGEVPIGVGLLRDIDLTEKRVLEVGAGLGLQTAVLARAGINAEAIEPEGVGFDLNHTILDAVMQRFAIAPERVHRIGAERLDPKVHGYFDVIFSVNVLEHIADLDGAIAAMASVLAPGGVMVHTCPNYTIPYEPHYGAPLLPFWPELTPWMGKKKREPVWQSLNFVTAGALRRKMNAAGLDISYERGLLADALGRALTDKGFAARHGAVISTIANVLQKTGGLAALRHLPPSWGTPLRFRCWKSG